MLEEECQHRVKVEGHGMLVTFVAVLLMARINYSPFLFHDGDKKMKTSPPSSESHPPAPVITTFEQFWMMPQPEAVPKSTTDDSLPPPQHLLLRNTSAKASTVFDRGSEQKPIPK